MTMSRQDEAGSRGLLIHAVQVLGAVLTFEHPADAVLSR